MPIRKVRNTTRCETQMDEDKDSTISDCSEINFSPNKDLVKTRLLSSTIEINGRFPQSPEKAHQNALKPPRFLKNRSIMRDLSEPEGDNEDEKQKERCCPRASSIKLRYSKITMTILFCSVAVFIIFAFLYHLTPMFKLSGPGILVARGAAVCILLLTMFALFLVTYDATT